MIDIIIPVLRRSQRVAPLLENISATTDLPHRVLFICSTGDQEEIQAVEEAGGEYLLLDAPPANGQFAKKVNLGFKSTDGEWLLLVGDDVLFQENWAEKALQHETSVISTNDRGNSLVRQQLLAVHPLVRRSYIEEEGGSLDGPGSVYHEGYSHNFVDCELSVLARARAVFSFAKDSIVQHMHPGFGKGPSDEVYEMGFRDFEADRELFWQRLSDIYARDRLVRNFQPRRRKSRR